ncbi:hypothetical protein [Microtetraspora malaysiensis]|uniref:hypothetical protein n=1 Tax=Microtetraspora malaysiensis TaxID=161358 RepID=UPI003D89CF5B
MPTTPPEERPGWGALFALTFLWLIGTPVLALLTFSYGFALMGATPANKSLSEVCAVATMVLGLGAPPVSCLLALAFRRRIAATVYGLISAALFVLAVIVVSRARG